MRKLSLIACLLSCKAAAPLRPVEAKLVAGPAAGQVVIPPPDDVRLPRGVTPLSYVLDLRVDPTRPRFDGKVTIDVALDHPARTLVLHGRDVAVSRASAVVPSGDFAAEVISRRAKGGRDADEELVLVFAAELPAGKARLDLEYSAPFAAGLRGLYRVKVADSWYAFTQLEAVDARRMFPCFDEPRFKTPFRVSVTAPSDMRVFANAPLQRAEQGGATTKHVFAATPPLPTYLIALAVGKLDVAEGAKEPFPIRLIAAEGKAALGKSSLDAANDFLRIFGEYFDRPYPYGKLDLVAVPDFGPGAMENAGLVTFREELLLVDGDNASLQQKRRMASVMAHELAHQWFGDLVTMPWWDDLWLNEGFATWMTAKACDIRQPSFGSRLELLAGKLGAMNADMLPSARPVRVPVATSDDILQSGGWSAYQKGGSVLSMLERWLGEGPFRDGLRAYVKAHEHGTVTSDDLLDALGRATGQDVARVAKSFLDQPGVPVVDVAVSCEGGKGRVRLRQGALSALPSPEEPPRRWSIPVCIDAGKAGSPCTLLDQAEATIELAWCPAWIYPNDAESGYYRFALDAGAFRALARAARKLPEAERIGLLSNSWALLQAGRLGPDALFGLLDAMSIGGESSRLVVEQAIGILHGLRFTLIDDAHAARFRATISRLLRPQAKRLGWEASKGEPENDRLLRLAVLSALADLAEDRGIVAEAEKRAARYLENPTSIDRDVAPLVVRVSARHGGVATLDALRPKLAAALPFDRTVLVAALGSFKDETTLRRALDLVLSGEVQAGDFRYMSASAGRHIDSRKSFSAWVHDHFEELKKKLGGAGGLASTIAWACDAASQKAALAFFDKHLSSVEGMQRSYEEGLAHSRLCIQMRARDLVATGALLDVRR